MKNFLLYVAVVMGFGVPQELRSQVHHTRALVMVVWHEILPVVLPACLSSPSCQLLNDEKELIAKIYRDLELSRQNTQIHFVKGEDYPDLFSSPDTPAHRLSVTGSRLGSPIYFDITEMKRLAENGQISYANIQVFWLMNSDIIKESRIQKIESWTELLLA